MKNIIDENCGPTNSENYNHEDTTNHITVPRLIPHILPSNLPVFLKKFFSERCQWKFDASSI